jgi:hypothetical protein
MKSMALEWSTVYLTLYQNVMKISLFYFIFIYGIFNDPVSSSKYIVLSGRMINVEGSGHGLFMGNIPSFRND